MVESVIVLSSWVIFMINGISSGKINLRAGRRKTGSLKQALWIRRIEKYP